jgi:hypothetical protein
MSPTTGKTPKKDKAKKQTQEERLESIRYSHMMYGPTAGERRPAGKRTDYGTAYLTHPKFQSLMTAFKKGASFKFDVTDKGKVYTIATEESAISFDGKTIYYSRPMSRYEDHLLMDRAVVMHYQNTDALVHLTFAVLRSLPELGTPLLTYMHHQYYYGADTLDVGMAQQGPNLLIGTYRHNRTQEKAR